MSGRENHRQMSKKPAPDQKVLDQMKTISAQMDRILNLHEDSGDWYHGVAHAKSYMDEAILSVDLESNGQPVGAEPDDGTLAEQLDDDETQETWEF